MQQERLFLLLVSEDRGGLKREASYIKKSAREEEKEPGDSPYWSPLLCVVFLARGISITDIFPYPDCLSVSRSVHLSRSMVFFLWSFWPFFCLSNQSDDCAKILRRLQSTRDQTHTDKPKQMLRKELGGVTSRHFRKLWPSDQPTDRPTDRQEAS